MKKIRIFIFSLLLISLFLPYIAVVRAREPKYVGIKEGDTFIWNTEFDKGPLEDYFVDTGDTEEDAERFANIYFRAWHIDEDYEAWKMVIHKIGDEGDDRYWDDDFSFDEEVLRVKYQYSLYKTKDKADPDAWKTRESWDSARLWDNDERFYWVRLFSSSRGIETLEDWDFPEFIVAKNLDFGEIVKHHEKWIEDNKHDDYNDVGTVKIQHFAGEKVVGIWTEENNGDVYPAFKNEIEDFESEARYNDDGVLYYYEWSYDGDTIAKFEKEYIFGQNTEFYFENWWWMSLVAGAVVIGVIIVICIIRKKRK